MLNARQQRFVEEYALDSNARQAAIRAGYAPKSATEIGFENLRKPHIAKAITANMARLSAKTDNTYEKRVATAEEVLEVCMGRTGEPFDANGALKANDQLIKLGNHYPPEKVDVGGKVTIQWLS
jgi:phage terminase small subunit